LGRGTLVEERIAEKQAVICLDCDPLKRKIVVPLGRIEPNLIKMYKDADAEKADGMHFRNTSNEMIAQTTISNEMKDNGEKDNKTTGAKEKHDRKFEHEAAITEGEDKDQEDSNEEEKIDYDYVGVPYHRSPGEVYYSRPDSSSQINHARVAEQGFFLGSGRVQTNFQLKNHDKKSSSSRY